MDDLLKGLSSPESYLAMWQGIRQREERKDLLRRLAQGLGIDALGLKVTLLTIQSF